jgi:hypothetical protein
METKTPIKHDNPPSAKPLLDEVHLLTDNQLADAFHILFGKDWKKYWTERDKAAEMRSIFNGGTQPCRPFENWVKLMEFLVSRFAYDANNVSPAVLLQDKINAFLKEQFHESWMDESDWSMFLEALETQAGVSIESLSKDMQVGLKNGHSIEKQFELMRNILKKKRI